ncbi:hypothetical protein [Comamonas antarctica]|uniref:DUF2867 domain-containing protein n=1 Tax=Comamonas antarctica TaxID=2743470 RepID=A0A6N1WZC6_9BURK|nr:hypothetical protein [Comamonas antarctica]QKV52499.1 hypothetical protein HUK68_06005 [Comamonas antarctica]
MHLHQQYLPDYHFSERHALDIAAPQAHVMAAARDYRPDGDALFKYAIAARELPMRALDRLHLRSGAPQPAFGIDNFTRLEQRGDEELLLGLAGKFWRSDYGQARIADGRAFLDFNAPGSAKLLLSFVAQKLDDAHTRLTTETRVYCLDAEARRRFAPYWYLIRPVSGLLRRRMLASIGHSARRGK